MRGQSRKFEPEKVTESDVMLSRIGKYYFQHRNLPARSYATRGLAHPRRLLRGHGRIAALQRLTQVGRHGARSGCQQGQVARDA